MAALAGLLTIVGSLLAVLVLPTPANAHGSTEDPPSRVYACRFDQPNNPQCADAWAANSQALYDWMEVNIGDAAGRHRQLIPDGQLCSAGRAKYAAFDRPGAWPVSAVRTDGVSAVELTYQNTAPHSTEYYRVYLTKPGFDARTDTLGWDDLDLVHDSGRLDRSPRQILRVTLPDRSVPAILYVVWQRSDSPEAFYACSDVTINAGTGPVPTTTPTPTTAPRPTSTAAPTTTVDPPPTSTVSTPSTTPATSPTSPTSSRPPATPPTTPAAPASTAAPAPTSRPTSVSSVTTSSSTSASVSAGAVGPVTAPPTSGDAAAPSSSSPDTSAGQAITTATPTTDPGPTEALVVGTDAPTSPPSAGAPVSPGSDAAAASTAIADAEGSAMATPSPTGRSAATTGGPNRLLLAAAGVGSLGLVLVGVGTQWPAVRRRIARPPSLVFGDTIPLASPRPPQTPGPRRVS
ncbi:MAG: lytic polysaccharide monooxygenase [Actinomycetota bacterium]